MYVKPTDSPICKKSWIIFYILFCLFTCSRANFQEVEVDEATAKGTKVHELPKPNSNFAYTLYKHGDPKGIALFSVTEQGEVILKDKLNYEVGRVNSYYIVAILRNKNKNYGGTAFTRKFKVIDSNDNSPVFAKNKYNGEIEEGLPAGSIVVGLEDCFATDLDSSGISKYEITAGNNNDEFVLDSKDIDGMKLLVVKTKKSIDRDEIRSTPYLDLGIRAHDGGKGAEQKFTQTTVHIKILDINDNPPVFIYPSWQRSIQENAIISSSVIRITATDNDEGQNAEIYYYFKEDTDDFYINPSSGEISVAAHLNAELKRSYHLKIVAQDKALSNYKVSEAPVNIEILDVPQYPPTNTKSYKTPSFIKKTFTVTVRADLPVKAFVFFAHASASSRKLEYTMSGYQSSFFKISRKSGVVVLQQKFDLTNVIQKFTLSVVVTDEQGSRDSMTLNVNVQPLNLNRHDPKFEPSTVSISIPQDIDANSQVGYTVRATDEDQGNYGQVSYFIEKGSGIGYFDVDSKSGRITTKALFKEPRVYDLYIKAQDNGLYKRYGLMYLRIHVKPVYTFAPVLSRAMYTGRIDEEEEQDSFVSAVFASSPSPGRNVIYEITGNSPQGLALDRETGVITTTQRLDYEREQYKFMEIIVRIQGIAASTRTVVFTKINNINDNPPVFMRPAITVHVAENSGDIPSLLCLFANDDDGDGSPVSYSIKSGNLGNVFSIDKQTGQLSAKNLDYEQTKAYNLQVTASDGSHEATAKINVQVADANDPPHFELSAFTAKVDEGASEGTLVKKLEVNTDKSNSHVCGWGADNVTPKILSLFTLTTEARSCVIKVAKSGSLKWRKNQQGYKFSIIAINKENRNQVSTALLDVSVIDQNDNQPEFVQNSYAVSLLGANHIGNSIMRVSAFDLDEGSNAIFTYSLPDSNLFKIEANGDIFAKSALDLNREYTLTVNARNPGSRPSIATIKLSVHPADTNLLTLTDISDVISISETSSVGTNVFKVSSNGPNVFYEIVGGNFNSTFQISPNGQVSLKKSLDFEFKQTYDLVVRAKVPTSPPQYLEKTYVVNVVDENDDSPTFAVQDPGKEQKVFVDQFSPGGTVVAKFKAYDDDSGINGAISYTIIGTVPFNINSDGVLTTASEVSGSVGTKYEFYIQAADNGRTPKTSLLSVSVEVKDGTRPPTFTQKEYDFSLRSDKAPFDNIPIGAQAGSIATSSNNPRSTATFKISSGDFNNSFCLDSTKILSVQRPIDFDSYHVKVYNLVVDMTYGYQTTKSNVRITLSDDNDNEPKFVPDSGPITVRFPELTPKGTVIYEAKAIDKDAGLNGKVTYSIHQVITHRSSETLFRIDGDTGVITLLELLDYETANEHVIIIKAQDNGNTNKKYALLELRVEVEDENDEVPTFAETKYVTNIPKNAKPGYIVLTVFAADFDSAKFKSVEYSIFGSSDYDGTFSIDKKSGEIRLRKPIALIDSQRFELKIRAYDGVYSGETLVNLIVVTYEGPPVFALPRFTFNVTENNNHNEEIGTVKAISLDVLTYSIVRKDENNSFDINPKTGKIYSKTSLDAEINTQYIFYVRATDLSERFTEASVQINVINTNDNSPTFPSALGGLIEVVKPRSLPVGQEVVKVEGVDIDVGDRLTYEIKTDPAEIYFEINPKTGVIISIKSLDDLAKSTNQYDFEVLATDLNGKQGIVRVHVILIKRRGETFIRSITEGQVPSASIITNIDYINYQSGLFKIVYPANSPFTIEPTNGHIGISRRLDYEQQSQYIIYVEETDTRRPQEYTNYRIQINVVDMNDNKPKFTMKNYLVKVNKNALPGTDVIKLSAEDKDSGLSGSIYFQLIGETVPFSIDPVSNYIKTAGFYLTKDWYNISVQAYDKGRPQQRSDLATVYIKTGDNPPEFTKNVYQFQVNEGAHTGTIIGEVQARSLSGISIQFTIVGGNQENIFTIDSNGKIILQGTLDYESGQSLYSLTVKATEISTTPLTSTTTAIIEILNVNDNIPKFDMVEYRSPPISENVAYGTTLLTVSATDCDCGQTCKCAGGMLTYTLQKYKDVFKIDHVTGEIKSIRPLDYDTQSEYRFQVQVHDDDEQFGVADVIISLTNENDNFPTFTPPYFTVSLPENIKRGAIVTTVQAQDLDGDVITYGIESGDKANFEIDGKTGVLRITTKSDPIFLKDKYVLNITGSDGVNIGRYLLTIIIEDINDNSPVFQQCASYTPSILEHSPMNSPVIQVVATDTDRGRNGEVEYELQEPQKDFFSTNDFKIDNTTGWIYSNKIFDREVKSSYIVLVIASDGGHDRDRSERNSASCQLEIQIQDINDLSPVFSVRNYDIAIADNTAIGTVVLEVSAQDKDEGRNARITYSIRQSRLSPEFKINPTTGEISVATALEAKQYSFQVEAKDNGVPPNSAIIEVDINVNPSDPPRFSQQSYTKSIKESVSPGTVILKIQASSQDQEDKSIFYSILPGNLPSTNKPPTFTVNSNTGELKVARVLDYEFLNEYILTVTATDKRGMKSNAKVFIKIEDVNDNAPLFVLSEYEIGKVTEGKPIGVVVEQVNATDADSGLFGQVRYSLEPSKESDMFSINPVTGKITTKVVFDRETTSQVTFNVKAQDQDPVNPLSSVVFVTITINDVNDNPPKFEQQRYEKQINEDAAVGSTVVDIKASDEDAGENSRLSYYIISGNEKGYFDTKRGKVDGAGAVIVAKPLDREDGDKFKLMVVASDGEFTAQCMVDITVKDVNDVDPSFLRSVYNSTIPENTPPGVFIIEVSATDLDTPEVQSPITYSLAKETDGYFEINKNTGKIVTGQKSFNREAKSVYTFLVYASDGTRTGTAYVKIIVTDVNDEVPKFWDGPYIRYVMENQRPNAIVGYVTAQDKDEGSNALITYSLLRDQGRFTIGINDGLIRTSKVLDRESEDNKFTIVVAATDRGASSLQGTVEVTIYVTDANDQYPYFTQESFTSTLFECADIGEEVTQLRAKDNDIGINAELIYAISSGNTPRRFRIDPDTGVITVAHKLNFEKEKGYKLFINVRDKGLPQLISKRNASVTVTVKDCNDNPPVFSQTSYTVDVKENEPIGYQIISVRASDYDTGLNGRFKFFIVDPDENYQFRMESGVNSSTGVVVLNLSLDREKRKQHILKIAARDLGSPPLTGYAQLVVNVLDVNDNKPIFEPSDFCGKVRENFRGVQQVATIIVTDPDGQGNGCPCKFQLLDSPTGGFFALETLSVGNKAKIKTTSNAIFDREETQIYKLTVSASDSGGLMATTTVIVEVLDENDNIPSSGGKQEILLNSYQGKFIGGNIGKIYIIDDDRGTNAEYQHVITSSTSDFLSIDNAGNIRAKANIESGKSYTMSIKSTEKNRGSSTVTGSVDVRVRKISEKLVKSSLPIRMLNVVKDLTCDELKYPDFEDVIAKILGVDVSQVVIFSAMDVPNIHRGVDIWFSVIKKKGADSYTGDDYEYYDFMEMLIKITEFKDLIERRTGGKVLSIGIDACKDETCTVGFCINEIQGSPSYTVVTDENGIVPPRSTARSFISIDVSMTPRCVSEPTDIRFCNKNVNPCLNGGTCVSVLPYGYSCTCLEGYDGPRCESTTRYLKGNGYFWLKPLSYFYSGEISFEFSTTQSNGLILFQGPISELSSYDVIDFLAIDLEEGKIRISVTQGEEKVYQKTLVSGYRLDDGIFHHVRVYKRGKFLQVVIDHCQYSKISESWNNPSEQDRTRCELTGVIPGRWRFINGIYPLQIGGLKDEFGRFRTFTFPSFKGCVRNIIDNDIMYDLKFPLAAKNSILGCPPTESQCPDCVNGFCDMTTKLFPCQCHFGWTGRRCDKRVQAYRYLPNSYSQYTLIDGSSGSSRVLRWYDKYVSTYMVQIKTVAKEGVIVYETSPKNQDNLNEYSVLQIKNGMLQYKYNLGDGELILALEGVNISNGMWHNISLVRRGAVATLQVMSDNVVVGSITGSEGTHQLLDSNGIIYVGSIVEFIDDKEIIIDDFQGCIAGYRYNRTYIDENDDYVSVRRRNVDQNCTATCGGVLQCLNGVCMAGSPPYCLCNPGFSGPTCAGGVGKPNPQTGNPGNVRGMIIIAILVILFLLALLLAALFMSGAIKKKRNAPIYVDVDGRENIMPYNEEGAGEDDFLNYDLEKLLQHVGDKNALAGPGGAGGPGGTGNGFSGVSAGNMTKTMIGSAYAAGGGGGGFGDGHGDTEPLLHSEAVFHTEATINTNMTSSSMHHAEMQQSYNQAEEIDIAAFISSRLMKADKDDSAYPRDTLLHYGYEGEGSDMDDLSELGDSESESEDEEDFSYLKGLGPEFDQIYHIYNYEPDDDV